eukprot:2445728-Lingulodinium_polyedra.AAC.1
MGVFTVAKKDGSLRLVFDRRPANVLRKKPPSTDLATASALVNLDFLAGGSVPATGDAGEEVE